MTDTQADVFHGRIIRAGTEEVVLPNGARTRIDIVRHPGASAVLALDDEGRACILRQYRPALAGWLWEVPAGKKDAGEDAELTARRELEEETGLTASQWQPLGKVATAAGFCDEVIDLFLARGLSHGQAQPEEHEILEVHWRPLAELLEWADRGEITDSKTLAALLRARHLI